MNVEKMKICERMKQEMEKKQGVVDESLLFTLCDLFCHLKCCYQWGMFTISIIATFCLYCWADLSECRIDKLSSSFLSVFSCTIGVTIAAYAIIIGFLPNCIYIKKNDTEKRKAYDVICGSMIFNGIVQMVTILIVLVYFATHCILLFYISSCLGCLSIIQILDILLQLLALRSFKY